jgi:hypothetical protein
MILNDRFGRKADIGLMLEINDILAELGQPMPKGPQGDRPFLVECQNLVDLSFGDRSFSGLVASAP